jgi:glycerol-3-phosphate acyltransferase PlsY
VANYLGFCSAITPVTAGLSILVWGGVFALLRVPFLSSFSMVAVLTVGMVQACGTGFPALAGIILTALFIIISHRGNLTEFFRLMGDPRQ